MIHRTIMWCDVCTWIKFVWMNKYSECNVSAKRNYYYHSMKHQKSTFFIYSVCCMCIICEYLHKLENHQKFCSQNEHNKIYFVIAFSVCSLIIVHETWLLTSISLNLSNRKSPQLNGVKNHHTSFIWTENIIYLAMFYKLYVWIWLNIGFIAWIIPNLSSTKQYFCVCYCNGIEKKLNENKNFDPALCICASVFVIYVYKMKMKRCKLVLKWNPIWKRDWCTYYWRLVFY